MDDWISPLLLYLPMEQTAMLQCFMAWPMEILLKRIVESTKSNATSVRVADFNGDSQLDLIVGDDSNRIRVLFGNMDGTFVVSSNVNVGGSVRDIEIGDIDGDGDVDAVVSAFLISAFVTLQNTNGLLAVTESKVTGGITNGITLAILTLMVQSIWWFQQDQRKSFPRTLPCS